MTKLLKVSLFVGLSAVSIASFAHHGNSCDGLVSEGQQASVIDAVLKSTPSLSQIQSCMAQCGLNTSGSPSEQAQHASQCVASLNTLSFATNYVDSLKVQNPNQFAGVVPPDTVSSGLNAPQVASNNYFNKPQQHDFTTPGQVAFQQPAQTNVNSTSTQNVTTPTRTYMPNPNLVKQVAAKAKQNNHAIRWY